MLNVGANIQVDENEFDFSFARSGGPGGQHVNKTSSKVILRWKVDESPGVPGAVKRRFKQQFRTRINDDGELVIDCDDTRSQHRNKELVIERLADMLKSVARPPKRRIKTRPSRSKLAKRRKARERHKEKKKQRRKPKW
jgi:ribosome-associated protein